MSQTEVSPSAEIWSRVLETFASQIPQHTLTTWIQPLTAQKLEGNLLFLGAPNQFHREWIEGHYLKALEQTLKDISGDEMRVRIQVVPTITKILPPPHKRDEEKSEIRNQKSEGEDIVQRTARALQPVEFDSRLNPRYLFENFIEGDSNSFARAACQAISDVSKKTPWNPLLIYGGSGMGKTHLLQAIGNQALLRNKKMKVLYVTSEKFTQEFIQSVRNRATTDFSDYYRSIDILLLDDVQFFTGKERTQFEFFHCFNTLYQNGKRVVITSDRPVTELSGFDARLTSRFASGLVTNIDPPDYETRVAILQRKAEEDDFPLTIEIADFLSTHIHNNIRELEGVYVTMVAKCQLKRIPPTLDLVREIVRSKIGTLVGRMPVEKIQEVVGAYFNIPVEALRGKSRKKEIAYARMIAMTLMTEITNHSLKTIGSFFGGRDHSTVIHARDTINELRTKKDMTVCEAFKTLERQLSASPKSGNSSE